MVKSLLALSMVASLALVTVGCGGSDNNDTPAPVDTAGPVFNNPATTFHTQEEHNSTITLQATDPSAPVMFSISQTPHFMLAGSALTFSAPAYEDNASNEYYVTVTAKDSVGNSSTKIFSFIVDPLKASPMPVPVGDKNLTVQGDIITGPAGLKWLNTTASVTKYSDAVAFCENPNNGKGFHIARRDQILNLIDYSKGNGVNASLLEDEFDKNDKATTWAQKVADTYFSVNFVAGADVIEPGEDTPISGGNAAQYTVMCVKGLPADPHTFVADEQNASIVIDQTTGMKWTKVDTDNDEIRRAIEPDDTTASQQKAADYCPAGFRLPTINELRTLVDYSDNSVNELVAPKPADTNKEPILWSSTKFTNSNVDKNYYLNTKTTLISAEVTSEAYFVTCVKATQ